MIDDLLYSVRSYISLGWSVIPVGTGTKSPCVPWKKYQKIRATLAEWNYWAWQFPGCGVAVICGQLSGVVGLDADGEQAIQWISELTNGYLDRAPAVQTFRGMRWLVQTPVPSSRSWTKTFCEGSSFTFLGESTSFILPPSVHPSGVKYRWRGRTTRTLDGQPRTVGDLPTCPGQILKPALIPSLASSENLAPRRPDASFRPHLTPGGRNTTLFRHARALCSLGYGPTRVAEMVRTANAQSVEPLPESEVNRLVKNALSYQNKP